MSRKKKDNAAQSTRQLMDIDSIKDYCIATRMGDLVFFIIKPTNISVLPDSSISARIYALLNVVKGQAEIEMLALNSKESFERNKNFYRERQDSEELPAIRRLLEQDSKHLDRIQVLMASSREFYIIIRLRKEKDNCQDTIFGGFAPNSQTAEVLSKALGSRTVLSGSVSRGKNDPSQSLQMMERALLTPDELKSIPKGSFIVMKTGTHPMRTRLQLFLNWGIIFGEPYTVPERANRAVAYANRVDLERSLPQLDKADFMDEGSFYAVSGRGGMAHLPAREHSRKRSNSIKTMDEEER